MNTMAMVETRVPISGRILWPFAKRFVAGTVLEQALAAVESFNRKGYKTTLDMLGEDVLEESKARQSAEQYVVMIKSLAARGLDKNVSVKLTQMGLEIDKGLCLENVRKIANEVKEQGGFLRIDTEGSATTSRTFDIVRELKKEGLPVGAVVQVMLRRSPKDITLLLEDNIPIRLCKGAYKEPKDIAYTDMGDIRRQYVSLMQRLLTSGIYHGIATHDRKLIDATREFAVREKIPKSAFEFQMLLGLGLGMQKELVREGWNLRLYVPYGSHWLPYCWRRLREKKENILFMVKGVLGI